MSSEEEVQATHYELKPAKTTEKSMNTRIRILYKFIKCVIKVVNLINIMQIEKCNKHSSEQRGERNKRTTKVKHRNPIKIINKMSNKRMKEAKKKKCINK